MRRPLLLAALLSCAAFPSPGQAQDLAAAISDALANAPAIAEAEAGEAAAGADLDRARAERNPLLNLEGSAGIGRIDNGGFFGITADDVNPLALQALAEVPLFTGGRISSAIDRASGGAESARLQVEQARLETTVMAVGAYAEVLTARRLETRFETLRMQLCEVERQAGLRFRAGEIASSEVAQARARCAEADAGLAQATGRVQSAEAAFERLTGKAPGNLAPLPPLPDVPASLDEAMDRARMANPALLQAGQGVRMAEAATRAARAEGMPTVGAFAEAAHVRDQFFPDYKSDSVTVGIRGRWTLFAGGRVAAQVRAADAELTGAHARERQVRLALDGMVIDAWVGLETASRMVEATRLRSEAAAEALRGTRLEAQVGAAPTLTVLDAEREAVEAEAALIEAEGMRQVAAWRLKALTGDVAGG